MSAELRYESSPERLDAVEPLWNALHAHHAEITPALLGRVPAREAGEAWRRRRAKYERWLADPDSFFVIAEDDGEPVGYAFVTVGPGYASWSTGKRLAELQTLSVLPGRRGAGIGESLLDAAWARLAELGVEDMAIVAATTNLGSHRFYERHGFERGFVVYYGRRDGTRRVGDPDRD